MRRIVIFAFALWAAVLVSVVTSFLFWRFGYLRPHAIWAVLSLVSIALPSCGLIVTVLWRLSKGPCRGPALGWLLLGATPLVWIGSYMTDLSIRGEIREAIVANAPLRIVMTWASSVMDLEARWRYSRWTHGRYAVLIDHGQTEGAERLVAEMDDHIRSMAALLGQQVPSCEFPWVRGPLVGVNAKAVLLWALCGQADNLSELTRLDRHEVAHTLITALSGADQYPPFVLTEGWAESQSKDRETLIRVLFDRHQDAQTYSLQDLVSPAWYSTDKGPVYWEGGPLVLYLMERYGPEKFFEFYSGVRRSTFHDDCVAILGNSWQIIEEDFWLWIDMEGTQIVDNSEKGPESGTGSESRISLAEGVSSSDWNEFVESYRSTRNGNDHPLPTNAAFSASLTRTDTDEELGLVDKVSNFEFRAVFEGESFWIVEDWCFNENQYLKVTPEQCAYLRGDDLESLQGWVKGPKASHDPRSIAENLMRIYNQMKDPGDLLLLTDDSDQIGVNTTIQELTRPETDDGLWTMICTRRLEDGSEARYELVLDPALGWLVTSYRYANSKNGPWNSVSETRYQRMGDVVLPLSVSTRSESSKRSFCIVNEQWRPLSGQEAEELKRQVDHAVQAGPRKRKDPYLGMRRTLLVSVIGCPLVGVLLVAFARRPTCAGG